MPSGIYVRIQVPLARLAVANAIAGIVVTEDVAVDAHAQAQIKAAHLAQVHGVPVREQYRVTGVRTASHEYARYAIAAGRARVEALDVLHVTVRVLPFGLVVELDVILALATLRRGEVVRGRRRQERQFGRDAGRQRRTAEQVHQLAERHSVHCKRICGKRGMMDGSGGRGKRCFREEYTLSLRTNCNKKKNLHTHTRRIYSHGRVAIRQNANSPVAFFPLVVCRRRL